MTTTRVRLASRAHPISRRHLLGSTALVGALTLAACRQSPVPEADPTVQTFPSRIVTLDPFSTYNLLDCGMEPIGAMEGLATVIHPDYREVYHSLPTVGTYFEPDFEQIATLAPDLILASLGQGEFETELAAIAPTTLVTAKVSSTWRQAAAEVAAAVGRQPQLEQLEQEYLSQAAKIKSDHATTLNDSRWAVVWQGKETGVSVRPADSNGGQVLAEAGVTFNALTTSINDGKDVELSWEEVENVADADVICLPANVDGSANPMTDLIIAHPLFQSLPAAKSGNTPTFANTTPGSYRNAIALLSELEAYLAGQQ